MSELPTLITSLPFPKTMRWSDLDITYARPLQWIVALLGKKALPFQIGPLTAGKHSRGHSQLDPDPVPIPKPSDYLETLKKHSVLVDPTKRKCAIADQLAAIEGEDGATSLRTDDLLPELVHLSEWPMLLRVTFDTRFLEAPEAVLISEMVVHQRYIPLAKNGALLPTCVVVADNTPCDEITQGNRSVLTARLSDGLFLFKQDLEIGLSAFAKRLGTVTLHPKLGTLADATSRLETLAEHLSSDLSYGDTAAIKRAAALCKGDLVSELVSEFPELQGTIGAVYARKQGEPEAVATAIEEHYLPRHDGDALPSSPEGGILALADKLDRLTSFFGIGLKPTSSKDPYALRRAALGAIRIAIEAKLPLDFTDFIDDADFLERRCATVLEQAGFPKDEVSAVLSGRRCQPYDLMCRLEALHAFRQSDAFEALSEVYKRARGQLTHDTGASDLSHLLLREPAEKALYEAFRSASPRITTAIETRNYEAAFSHLATFQAPLAGLFDTVRILDDDKAIRANRLTLLRQIFTLFDSLIDLSKLQ